MSSALYPILIGESFPVLKTPVHSNQIQTSVSGKEVRIAGSLQERFQWEIPYGYANHDPAIATADLQTIMGFYNARHGSFDSFLYEDPTDNYTIASAVGIGDGSTTVFQLTRTMEASVRKIYATTSTPHYVSPNLASGAPILYLNGTPTGGATVNANTGVVTFGSAPGAGVAITVSMYFLYRVRFLDDSIDYSNDAGPYWTIKKVTLFETN